MAPRIAASDYLNSALLIFSFQHGTQRDRWLVAHAVVLIVVWVGLLRSRNFWVP
mgnify:CR=1 FL=1